ncbi:hypothetical protein BC835DRAFT_1331545 [Cytidiella melzeri]|nr:hypothetical protein BC835DRAFT_1331545 [Cytidiella melzeri]
MSSSSSTSVHTHDEEKCPVTGASGANPHSFRPPQDGDSRAPCPAMNSMANHGYLPRDGKEINADIIVKALMECFRLSKPLAWFLTHGALTLLHQGSGNFQLSDLARHNHIEHNASLYHPDAGPREEYAPIHGDPELLDLVFKDSEGGVVMTPEDVARVRVRRELTSNPPLDFIHAELARGEISIVLNMFNNPDPELHASKGVPLMRQTALGKVWGALLRKKRDPQTTPLDGAPIDRMRYWFEHERLPEGWKPYHKTTLTQTIVTVSRMRSKMHALERENKKKAKSKPISVPVSAPPVVVEKVEERKSLSVLDEACSESEGEDRNTLTVPPLIHTRDGSATSATSSTFSDALHTPQASEFVSPAAPKDVHPHELYLPEIVEHSTQKITDIPTVTTIVTAC